MVDCAGEAVPDGKKEAIKTYIEQTKLLVTLASAFIFAPAGLVAILKDRTAAGIGSKELVGFIVAEFFFISSVFAGYVVLGTITGSQEDGTFDVYRPATMRASLAQVATYLLGLLVFILLAVGLVVSH
jgi:hypothetical protein